MVSHHIKQQPNARGKKLTPRQRGFLAAVAKCGNISRAAELARCRREQHYRKWLDDPAYRVAFDHAMEEACQRMEAEAHRRAVEGVDRAVFHGGKKVGVVREYSDKLLIFLLQARRPQVYRRNVSVEGDFKHEQTGPVIIAERVVTREDLQQMNADSNGETKDRFQR